MSTFILILLTLTGLFMMFIILLQRGRGGGLAGALGGAGGQSAFGTKAGDVFTRITIGVAVFWVILACVSIFVVTPDDLYTLSPAATQTEISPDETQDADQPADASVEAGAEGGKLDVGSLEESTKPATDAPAEKSEPPAEKK